MFQVLLSGDTEKWENNSLSLKWFSILNLTDKLSDKQKLEKRLKFHDKTYEEIGINKEDITAEFLASTTHIDEFYVDFEDNNEETQQLGECYQNNDDDEQYKIKILEMKFIDINTGDEYYVKQNVLDDYNNGI